MIGDCNEKRGSQGSALECKGVPGVTGKFGLGVQSEAGQVVVVVKTLPANAGLLGELRGAGSILGLGRSPGGGNGNPF